VLSTVKREDIRVIGANPDGQISAVPPLAMTYGEPSGDVMHSVMHVDPQPPVAEKGDLLLLTELVDQGRYKDSMAIELMARLLAKLGSHHPQLLRLQRSIQRQEALKR
jgi:predicted ATP-binding protein involved in virulence